MARNGVTSVEGGFPRDYCTGNACPEINGEGSKQVGSQDVWTDNEAMGTSLFGKYRPALAFNDAPRFGDRADGILVAKRGTPPPSEPDPDEIVSDLAEGDEKAKLQALKVVAQSYSSWPEDGEARENAPEEIVKLLGSKNRPIKLAALEAVKVTYYSWPDGDAKTNAPRKLLRLLADADGEVVHATLTVIATSYGFWPDAKTKGRVPSEVMRLADDSRPNIRQGVVQAIHWTFKSWPEEAQQDGRDIMARFLLDGRSNPNTLYLILATIRNKPDWPEDDEARGKVAVKIGQLTTHSDKNIQSNALRVITHAYSWLPDDEVRERVPANLLRLAGTGKGETQKLAIEAIEKTYPEWPEGGKSRDSAPKLLRELSDASDVAYSALLKTYTHWPIGAQHELSKGLLKELEGPDKAKKEKALAIFAALYSSMPTVVGDEFPLNPEDIELPLRVLNLVGSDDESIKVAARKAVAATYGDWRVITKTFVGEDRDLLQRVVDSGVEDVDVYLKLSKHQEAAAADLAAAEENLRKAINLSIPPDSLCLFGRSTTEGVESCLESRDVAVAQKEKFLRLADIMAKEGKNTEAGEVRSYVYLALCKHKAENRHNPLDAAAHCQWAVDSSGGDPRTHYELGRVLFESGNYTRAIEAFQEARSPYLPRSDVYYYLGRAQFEVKQYEEALDSFHGARAHGRDIKEDGYYRNALRYAIRFWEASGDFKKAAEAQGELAELVGNAEELRHFAYLILRAEVAKEGILNKKALEVLIMTAKGRAGEATPDDWRLAIRDAVSDYLRELRAAPYQPAIATDARAYLDKLSYIPHHTLKEGWVYKDSFYRGSSYRGSFFPENGLDKELFKGIYDECFSKSVPCAAPTKWSPLALTANVGYARVMIALPLSYNKKPPLSDTNFNGIAAGLSLGILPLRYINKSRREPTPDIRLNYNYFHGNGDTTGATLDKHTVSFSLGISGIPIAGWRYKRFLTGYLTTHFGASWYNDFSLKGDARPKDSDDVQLEQNYHFAGGADLGLALFSDALRLYVGFVGSPMNWESFSWGSSSYETGIFELRTGAMIDMAQIFNLAR